MLCSNKIYIRIILTIIVKKTDPGRIVTYLSNLMWSLLVCKKSVYIEKTIAEITQP